MIVQKFGGTSLGDAECIRKACSIITSHKEQNPRVVVSAVGGITNKLIDLAHAVVEGNGDSLLQQIIDTHTKILEDLGLDPALLDDLFEELSLLVSQSKKSPDQPIDNQTLDLFQSFGERLSSQIVAHYVTSTGLRAVAYHAGDIGMVTNDDFGCAELVGDVTARIRKSLSSLDHIPIVTGFLGKTTTGATATLGRGGSDYSAAIIGAALNVDEIQIWTDVNGILTADPRLVKDAKTISTLSFSEASELAYFGARVLHPKSINPAMLHNIPVKVLNSFDLDHQGTTIVSESPQRGDAITSIAYKKNVTVIRICSTRMLLAHGFLAKIFEIFEKYKVPVDVIATSEVSVSLTIDTVTHLSELVADLEEIARVNVHEAKSIICVVGEGMRHTVGFAGKVFSCIGNENINIEVISQGASEINITFVINSVDVEKAVVALHKDFVSK